MKSIILTVAIALTGVFMGCEKVSIEIPLGNNISEGNILEDDTLKDDASEGDTLGYKKDAIEIPYTEYSLSETSCQWKNIQSDKVIIINNDEELQGYLICTDDDYSKIDFSKHSLLLLKGMASSYPVTHIDINFSEAINEYKLDLIVYTGMATMPSSWLTSIIVPKINDGAEIILNLQQKYG
jgi:hypothetical protein